MKRKTHPRDGFMGSCPIAGVIWQHVHYIVGAPAARHDVYYIEDSARLPYNPETFEVNNEFDYAGAGFSSDWARIRIQESVGVLRAYLRGHPAAGLSLKRVRQLIAKRRNPEHLRRTGIQRRPARKRSHYLCRKRSGRGADQKSIR